jgi:hypothetical protein
LVSRRGGGVCAEDGGADFLSSLVVAGWLRNAKLSMFGSSELAKIDDGFGRGTLFAKRENFAPIGIRGFLAWSESSQKRYF